MRNLVAVTLLFLVLACVQNENLPQKSKEQIINDFFLKKTGIDLSKEYDTGGNWLELSKPVHIPELGIEFYYPYMGTTIECLYIFDNNTKRNYFKCNANDAIPNINELRKNETTNYVEDIGAFGIDSMGYFREKTYPEQAIEDYLNDAFLDSLISFERFKLLLDTYYENENNLRKIYYDINDTLNVKNLMKLLKSEIDALNAENRIEMNKKNKLLHDVNYMLLPPGPHDQYKLIYSLPDKMRFRVIKLLVHSLHANYHLDSVNFDKFYYSMVIQDISLYTEY